jgi:20S proteasome alpha/beta subunit
MTLIIAAQGENFVIVGADSRETVDVGAVRVEVNMAQKMTQLTNHALVLFCGDAGYAQNLIQKFKATIVRRHERGITQLTDMFSSFCQKEAVRTSRVPTWPLHSPHSYYPNIGFILGGLDMEQGRFIKPSCYGLSSYRGYRPELGLQADGGGFVLDGKPMIARYLFAHHYRAGMNIKDLSTLVAQCLFDTARVDGDVGGRWKMAIVKAEGVTMIGHDEVEDIIDTEDLRW